MTEQQQTSPAKSASTVRLALWLTFIAFLLIVFVFRSNISEIKFGNEGVSAKMVTATEVNKLSPEDRKAASDDLAQRISALETEARTSAKPARAPAQAAAQNEPDTAPVTEATYQQPIQTQQTQPQQASIPNIAGVWTNQLAGGLAYQITQYGNYVLISEINQGIVEAAAAGPINGFSFNLQVQTILNTTGTLSLTVSADQRHMNGQYRDNTVGQVVPIVLNR